MRPRPGAGGQRRPARALQLRPFAGQGNEIVTKCPLVSHRSTSVVVLGPAMGMLDSFIREIEEAIASGETGQRSRNLRQLTDLFLDQAAALNDDHVSVFDEVILLLVQDAEQDARVELSMRLADVGNAPSKIVKTLARDAQAAVAEPILQRSPQLSDDDLAAVAGERAQEHLLAISRRATLSERITDVLVERGDSQVACAIAQNAGAKLSGASLSKLVKKAQQDGALRSLLQKRPGLAAEQFRAYIQSAAPNPSASQAKPEAAVDMRRLQPMLAKLAKAMVAPAELSDRDISPGLERLGKTAKGKAIEEVRVANWIKANKMDDALAAIAHNAGLPGAAVVAAYEAESYEPLLVIVRAARLSWNSFKLLFTARDGQALPGDVLKNSFEIFQQVPIIHAQKLGRLLERKVGSAAGVAA